ncbi:MAG: potassium channel family protein [Desulfarculaceae bacterium]|nr:potassium channel family protein [Desulfarculaceae bacterium]MCF8072126.1 potassium channel family protein [Desulfarculaceae bacterium]MCF8100047.1 potassium channel family protein [Desulfarculaceae bacterium]MCF8118150.1 potassium channel family protein [Desulfarculaceae bacterium]
MSRPINQEGPSASQRRPYRLPWFKSQYLWLFITLMLYLLAVPVVEQAFPRTKTLLDLFIVAVLMAGAYSVMHKRRVFILSVILLLAGLVLTLGEFGLRNRILEAVGCGFLVVFLIMVLVGIMRDVMSTEKVTFDTISGALCGYLLLGILWGFAFQAIEMLWPGSFEFSGTVYNSMTSSDYAGHNWVVLFYFSFVTLTTTGYGDITPLSNVAGQLAITEAVVGQFYMVVLVARLVAVYSRKKD